MKFEWDDQKSISNKEKHGIGFELAKNLWLDDKRVEIHIAFTSEERWALIAAFEDKMWAAIYTMRNDVIRLISDSLSACSSLLLRQDNLVDLIHQLKVVISCKKGSAYTHATSGYPDVIDRDTSAFD